MKRTTTLLFFVLSLALTPARGLFAQETQVTVTTCIVNYNDPQDPSLPAGEDVRQLEIAVDGDVVQVRRPPTPIGICFSAISSLREATRAW